MSAVPDSARANGDLRVWWIPQVPMKPFLVSVPTVEEGARLLQTLAAYDLFQLEHRIRPDFANAGGLEVNVDGEWGSWWDDETGMDDPIEWLAALSEPAP